ncbi:MAG: hypothetical protein ACRC33_04810 [Gemmataceae bacterium]
MSEFTRDGLRLAYPEGWKLDLEPAEGGWTVTLQSPGTAFLVVRMDASLPTAEEVADAAVEALRAEYKDVDARPALGPVAGDMAVGHDIEFTSLDVPAECWTRSFYGPGGTVLAMGQVSTIDADEYGPVLEAIRASMAVVEDD